VSIVKTIPLLTAKRECEVQTILVVDDEPIVLAVTARILSEAGFRALIADGAEAAIKLCHGFARPIDVALLDVMMPGKGGPDLAEDLIALHPEIAVVFMSGYEDYRFEKYRPFSFKWFIRKPFKAIDLLAIIQRPLDEVRKLGPRREENITYIRKSAG